MNVNESFSRNLNEELAFAVERCDLERTLALLSSGASSCKPHLGWPPIVRAAFSGARDVVAALLDAGADANQTVSVDSSFYGASAFMLAVSTGHDDCATLLAERGAEIDLLDARGVGAIHVAAEHLNSYGIKLILSLGGLSSLRAAPGGASPLHLAALSVLCDDAPWRRCLSALLAGGADPFAKDDYGASALHFAARSGNASACSDLLEIGLDPLLSDELGRTPLSIAATSSEANASETLSVLEAALMRRDPASLPRGTRIRL